MPSRATPTQTAATRVLALAATLLIAGCFKAEVGLDSPAPSKRLEAILDAAASDDRSAISDLIDLLSSESDTERFMAISALRQLTEQAFGYRFSDPEWKRRDSINRWKTWAEQQVAPTENARPGAADATEEGP